jgi:hypothetical protein
MDIVHDVWTLSTSHGQLSMSHGQLSMDNRCPRPIVHETNKTPEFSSIFQN